MYIRLNCIVEGQTEETFVNRILKPPEEPLPQEADNLPTS